MQTTMCFQLLLIMSLGLNAGSAFAAQTGDPPPLVAPIHTEPEGQTYGRWAAAWWQWALGIPAATNPLTDTTGEHCTERQVDKVWFLAGSISTSPVVRACEIPAAKSLFFPLINTIYGAFLNDPADIRTEEFVRAAGSCTEPAQISVSIDGFELPEPLRFFTGVPGSQSPFFNVQMPPGNLVCSESTPPICHELVLSPSAEQGYYLFVRPLSPGTHTIRWVASGCVPGLSQDVTYDLTVNPLIDDRNDGIQPRTSGPNIPPHHGLPARDRVGQR